MSLIPHRFLIRPLYQSPYTLRIPDLEGDHLVELSPKARLDPMAALDNAKTYADVRLGWNEAGIGVVAEVKGKTAYPLGEMDRPRQSDGLTLWLDTRGDRTSHRALKTCHQFHFAASGAGTTKEEPYFQAAKIPRALADAPLVGSSEIMYKCQRIKTGYRIEAFLPAGVLSGYDPEQFPLLGVYYSVRDFELGDDNLLHDGNFPFWEDPSLWASLELVK
jgi:hypothetical protein